MERQTSTGDKTVCANHQYDSTGTTCIVCGYNKIDGESFSNMEFKVSDTVKFMKQSKIKVKAGVKITARVTDTDAFGRKIKPYIVISIDDGEFADATQIIKIIDVFKKRLILK